MKWITPILLCLLFISVNVTANDNQNQDEDRKIFSITLYPLPAIVKWYSAEAEIAFSEHFSLAVDMKYAIDSDRYFAEAGPYSDTSKYLETGAGLRFYPRMTHDGFFIGAYANYVSFQNADKDTNKVFERYKGYNISSWLGARAFYGYLVIEASAGAGYASHWKSMEFEGLAIGVGLAL